MKYLCHVFHSLTIQNSKKWSYLRCKSVFLFLVSLIWKAFPNQLTYILAWGMYWLLSFLRLFCSSLLFMRELTCKHISLIFSYYGGGCCWVNSPTRSEGCSEPCNDPPVILLSESAVTELVRPLWNECCEGLFSFARDIPGVVMPLPWWSLIGFILTLLTCILVSVPWGVVVVEVADELLPSKFTYRLSG